MGDGRVVLPLVGRDAQLALADRRWGAAREGTGHLLLVSGEAGIGKTRLLREIAARIGEDARQITTMVFPRDAEAAGAVIIDLANELRRDGLGPSATALLERLLASESSGGDQARVRRLLVGDLAEMLVALLGERPTLLAIEDLHWADGLSLDILERVAMSLATTPSLVVATIRSDELYPRVPLRRWRARLLSQRLAEEVRLDRLDRDATATVIAGLTESTPSSTVVAELFDRSDGIPLHIEELVAAGSAFGVPDSVAEAVTSRFDLLSAHARLVGEAGAAIGRSFDIDLLQAALDVPVDMDGALTELTRAQLVVASADRNSLDFRHALIRDVIYDAIQPVRRRGLHERIARAALGIRSDAYVSDQFERASLPAEAFRLAMQAAADAVRISAHREAVELFHRAQRTTPRVTSDVERAALNAALAAELSAADDNAAAERNLVAAIEIYRREGRPIEGARLVAPLVAARHLLGVPLASRIATIRDAQETLESISTGESRAVLATLGAALAAAYMLDRQLDAAIHAGSQTLELISGDNSPGLVIDVQLSLGSAMVFSGPDPAGWVLLERAVAAATQANLEAQAARAYRMIGTSASALAQYSIAERWITEGMEYSAHAERWNDHHYLTSHRAQVHWARGELDAAEATARRALADGRGGLTTELTARHVLGWVALARDQLDAARSEFTRALEQAQPMDELQRIGPIRWGLAQVALYSGDAAEAARLCEAAREQSARSDDAAYLFPFLVTGTRALVGSHDLPGARQWADAVSEVITRRALPGTVPSVDHAAGLIALAEGNTGNARELLERANAGWMSLGRFWEAAQCILDLARCAHRSRRPVDAAAYIDQAENIARATGAALISRLAHELAVPGVDGPLTARELDVARLVSRGATNSEIASALTISSSTVASHIEHILAKLGVGRRAEIAAWVAASAGGVSGQAPRPH
jgi:DNA-binding CsgD family transcriptional regulator/tetratricopeptide (TPR) repeat protein